MLINKSIQLAFEYYQAGNLQQAEHVCKKILKKQPKNFDVLHLLGVIYSQLGNCELAIKYIKRALNYNSNIPEAYNHLGIALCLNRQFDEAITCYKKAIQLNPNFADAYNNLGNALRNKEQFDEAITCYKKAIQLNPNFADAYNNLGNTLQEQGWQDKALSVYDMALFFKPDYVKVRWARCIAHLPIIYSDQSSIQASRIRYHEELIKLRDIISLKTPQDIEAAAKAVGSVQPFFLAYQGFNDRELQQLYGDLVCQIMASRYPQFADYLAMPPLSDGELIRVGIVSGFFHLHSVWEILTRGWVQNLDKQRFSLYGYHTGKGKDKETDIARQSFSRFVEDIYSFEDLCKTIREDNLHILIYPEIGMHPMTTRLAALRLAPIQCASWGHPDTSGFPTIDYFLSSDLMEPPEADDHYTERLIRLPNLSIYYTPLDVPSLDVSRDTFNLRPNSVLYHCCQSMFKYLPQYDEVYPRIAQQVGNCQFLFISYPRSNLLKENFQKRIKQAFNKFNLNVDEYVVFLPYLEKNRYNATFYLADVFLDPIGWSGCNTVLGAIVCNLPVITFPSFLMRGRESLAILTMMGLTETVASSLDEYVALAAKLGRDSEWRQYISDKISKNKQLVYRDRACISALEDFLERVVKERLA